MHDVKIREFRAIQSPAPTPAYIEASIRELEQMRDAGEIELQAYLIKKQALVKMFLKSSVRQSG